MSDLYFDIMFRSSSSSSTSTSSSSESSSSSSSSAINLWNATYLSNLYWEGSEGTGFGNWIPSSSSWESINVANSAVILVSASNWQEDYRPTKVRVTTSPPVTGAQFSLDDKFGNIVSDALYVSGEELDITVTTDIYGISVLDDNPFHITAIEFYEG